MPDAGRAIGRSGDDGVDDLHLQIDGSEGEVDAGVAVESPIQRDEDAGSLERM